MAASYCHDEPAAVWVCACSPASSFCETCLLRHAQEPGAHTVSHHGPPGQYVCGMCKRATDHAISCRYPVCLCRHCAERLSVGSGDEDVRIGGVAEPELPAEGRQVGREAPSSLLALLTQKRNDARQRLLQTLDNMNNFDEVFAKVVLLEQELAQCKDRLRTAEAALAERSVEAQRFHSGEVRTYAADPGQLLGIIERVEGVSRENERLKNDNQSLVERVHTLEKQLMDQQSLNYQLNNLSSEIEKLQENQQEQLQTAARVTAIKVADAIPVVSQLTCDSEWLNSDIAENLFQLASLGISNVLDSADIRVVARVSLLLAKLLGPCEEMTVFSKDVLALLIKNPERGVNLLKDIEAVYLRAKGEGSLREVLKGVMKLIGTRECEDSMNMSARFSKVLSLKALCEFTIGISKYYSRREQDMGTWKEALMEIPLDWADKQLAAQCFGNLMTAIVKGGFSTEHLTLLQLLRINRPADERTMLTFAERAGALLNLATLKQQLTPFILVAIAQIEFARGMVPAEGQELCKLLWTSIKLIGEHATTEEIQRSLILLQELNPRSRHCKSLTVFVRLLSRFTSEEKLRIFGFGTLEWLLPNAKIRDNVSFADFIFQQIGNVGDFEETAANIGILLRDLTISEFPQGIENSFRNLLGLGTRISLAAQLCILFNAAKRETEGLIRAWGELLNASGDKRKTIDAADALLQTRQEESLLTSLRAFEKMAPLGLPLAAALIQEVHSVLRGNVPEREQLTTLLKTVLGVLRAANPPSSLAFKCLCAWKDGRARGSKQTYAFCQFVLQKIGTPNIDKMLDDVIATFAQVTISTEVVSLFLEIYQADGNNPSILSRQLTALIKLRDVDALGPLLTKLKNRPMPSQHRTLLINSVLDMSTPGSVHATCSATHTLINATGISPLLAVLCQLQEPGVVKDFLGTAQQNPSAVAVIVQMASLFVELEAQGVREVSLSAGVKNALLQRATDVNKLLPGLMRMLQNHRNGMGALCLKLIGQIIERPPDAVSLLTFVCDLARDLVDSVGPNTVNVLCNVLLAAKHEAEIIIVQNFQRNFLQIKDRLIALINRVQNQVSLQDVDGLMPKAIVYKQARELVNVQPSLIRFFDFNRTQWRQPVQLRKQIQFNSEYSSHTILDDETIFCCGGTIQAGNSNSMATVVYILSRDGTVTDLPPMNVARGGHGIIFIDGIRTVYVFGSCER